jgi:hypothetical protein
LKFYYETIVFEFAIIFPLIKKIIKNARICCRHLFIVSEKKIYYTTMQHTKKNIRIIRDKLSRIGIGEKNLDDETILESYSINKFGRLCAIQK